MYQKLNKSQRCGEEVWSTPSMSHEEVSMESTCCKTVGLCERRNQMVLPVQRAMGLAHV